ncbi:hypothetical protein AB4490_14215 [Vibrio cyclitrophicus]
MKTFLTSFTTTIEQRLSNPLVGSFVLSWVVINIKTIISIVSLSGQARVQYLNTLQFDCFTDALFPMVGALIYMLLVPFIQRRLDNIKYNFIDSKRKKDKNTQRRLENIDTRRLNRTLSASTPDYWAKVREAELEERRELAKANLSNWSEERNNLEAQVSTFTSKEHAFIQLNKTFTTIKENNQKLDSLKATSDYDSLLADMERHDVQVNKLLSHIFSYVNGLTDGERSSVKNSLLKGSMQPLGSLNQDAIAILLKDILDITESSILAADVTLEFYDTQKQLNVVSERNAAALQKTPYYSFHEK